MGDVFLCYQHTVAHQICIGVRSIRFGLFKEGLGRLKVSLGRFRTRICIDYFRTR